MTDDPWWQWQKWVIANAADNEVGRAYVLGDVTDSLNNAPESLSLWALSAASRGSPGFLAVMHGLQQDKGGFHKWRWPGYCAIKHGCCCDCCGWRWPDGTPL